MKLFKYGKLLTVFYKRNYVKNALMVFFLLLSNLTISVFLFFFASSQTIIPVLHDSYFEKQSVNLSKFASVPTNNELINVRTYERPTLAFMNSLMTRTGRFDIRPDYTTIMRDLDISVYDKKLARPLIVTYMHGDYGIGINEAFYNLIEKEVTHTGDDLVLTLELNSTFLINNEERHLNHHDSLFVNFVYAEPAYFSTPKLYIPESYFDASIGRYIISEGITLTNYLLNINPHDELANMSLRCHFETKAQYELFMNIIRDITTSDYGYEISSDHLNKIKSFIALYDYLDILIKILFVFVLIALIVILVVIAHTSLLANMRQMALLNVLGAKKGDLYVLFFLLLTFNFVLGLASLLLLPFIVSLFNNLLFLLLRLNISLTMNVHALYLVMSASYLFLIFIISLIFLLNMRRPLLYLLLDA